MSEVPRDEASQEAPKGQAVIAPLPRSSQQMLALRKIKAKRSINDLFEDLYLRLIDEDEEYARLLDAIYDSEAVHGSLPVDNVMAALQAQKQAIRLNIIGLREQNLTTLLKAQGVCVRRYGMDRKTRRGSVGGVPVEPVSPTSETNNDFSG